MFVDVPQMDDSVMCLCNELVEIAKSCLSTKHNYLLSTSNFLAKHLQVANWKTFSKWWVRSIKQRWFWVNSNRKCLIEVRKNDTELLPLIVLLGSYMQQKFPLALVAWALSNLSKQMIILERVLKIFEQVRILCVMLVLICGEACHTCLSCV